jgi:hypothetical protein
MRFSDHFAPGPPAEVVRDFVLERNATPELQLQVEGPVRARLEKADKYGAFHRYRVPHDPRRGRGRLLPVGRPPRPSGPSCGCLTSEEHLSGCRLAGRA